MKNSPLLAEGRERNGIDSKRASALRGSSAAEESAIERWTSKLCMFPCRSLAISMFDRNPERIEPRADNKGKMPMDRRKESDADCQKPAKLKE